MGMRFRKSVKICKGVKVNFSKSGASLSVGGKGHTVNFSSRGATVTNSIPGTGISWQSHYGNSVSQYSRPSSTLPSVKYIRISSDGKYTFEDATGKIITDETVLRKLKAMPNIKTLMKQLDQRRRTMIADKIDEKHEEMQHFLNLHTLAPVVVSKDTWMEHFQHLHAEQYIPRSFDTPCPKKEGIYNALEEEAESAVKTLAFWKVKKLKKRYIDERLEERFQSKYSDWLAQKELFDKEEQQKQAEKNKLYLQEFETKRHTMQLAIDGDCEYINSSIDDWFHSCTLPVEINISYSFNSQVGTVFLDMDLPEIEDIPDVEYSQLVNGNLKEKKKTQVTLRQEYAALVFGLAIFVAANIFCVSPAISSILISGYTQRPNKAGEICDDYIYSIAFLREAFENKDLHSVDPLDFCMQFQIRCNMTSTRLFKKIIPFSPEEFSHTVSPSNDSL